MLSQPILFLICISAGLIISSLLFSVHAYYKVTKGLSKIIGVIDDITGIRNINNTILARLDKLEKNKHEHNTAQGIDNIKSEFANRLSEDIAALKSPENAQLDAYSILEKKFDKQHAIYIKLHNSLDATDKDRFGESWQAYYGEDGEQEWQLPDMYSVSSSNQMKNTAENTKESAINKIEKILRLCR